MALQVASRNSWLKVKTIKVLIHYINVVLRILKSIFFISHHLKWFYPVKLETLLIKLTAQKVEYGVFSKRLLIFCIQRLSIEFVQLAAINDIEPLATYNGLDIRALSNASQPPSAHDTPIKLSKIIYRRRRCRDQMTIAHRGSEFGSVIPIFA